MKMAPSPNSYWTPPAAEETPNEDKKMTGRRHVGSSVEKDFTKEEQQQVQILSQYHSDFVTMTLMNDWWLKQNIDSELSGTQSIASLIS